jgi:two-component system nitrate/nitrite response regulator NarL
VNLLSRYVGYWTAKAKREDDGLGGVVAMEKRVSTIIIEPRLVLREALELLMGNHSYRVVCGVSSIAEITPSVVPDGPELVILGAQSAHNASSGAEGIRSLWPGSKIIFLFDDASPEDFHHLLLSQIDGCIPLFVSPDTLIGTLDLIVSRNVRVMVMGDAKAAAKCPPAGERLSQSTGKPGKPPSNGNGRDGMPAATFGMMPISYPTSGDGLYDPLSASGPEYVLPAALKLSDRESQILDGLVRGQANKVIARKCDITEATVKVHMKSILRKIRVGNRTQAAIWALEHGYCSDGAKPGELKPNETSEAEPFNGFDSVIASRAASR